MQGTFSPAAQTSTGTVVSSSVPSPNFPHELAPQATTVPFFNRAKLSPWPAEIASTSLRSAEQGAFSPIAHTGTGTGLVSAVPLPRFSPHATTVPFFNRARLCVLPAAIDETSLSKLVQGAFSPTAHTRTGTELLSVVPSPNSPSLSSPHATTVPFFNKARLCVLPAAIDAASLRSATQGAFSPTAQTRTGTELLSVVPLPSSPSPPSPHATTVPFANRARLCPKLKPSPADTDMTSPRSSAHGTFSPTAQTPTGRLLLLVVPLPNCPASL